MSCADKLARLLAALLVTTITGVAGVAQAANYSLPSGIGSGPFSSCSGTAPTYSCSGNVNFGGIDTINLTAAVTLNVGGNFTADKSLTITSNGHAFAINVGGDFTIKNNASINAATVVAGGNIDLKNTPTLIGNFTAGGNITMANNATVTGNLTAGGNITTGTGANITGNVDAGGTLTVGSGTITGSCSYASTNYVCSATGPNHYELSLPTSGIACLATPVTVTACADTSSPCTSAYAAASGTTATLATSGGTLGATTVTFNASGVATTTLAYPAATDGAAVAVTLSGEQTAASSARKCCPDGANCTAANSCSTTFSTAGFIFSATPDGAAATVSSQDAGIESATYYLRAVKTSDATKACESALTSPAAVSLAYQCNNPATCHTSDAPVCGSGNGYLCLTPYNGATAQTAQPLNTSVNMYFDANGNAPFTFNYRDVGTITLSASKAPSGSLLSTLSGSTNAFVVKPYGFQLASLACDNADKTSTSAGAFCVAGGTFTGTVTPFYYINSPATHNYGGVTPSFGKETSAQTVSFVPDALVNPTAAAGGTLSDFTSTATGSFGGTPNTATATMVWPEVGTITVKPGTLDYLGAGDITAAGRTDSTALTGSVGRFYPKDFDLNAGSSFTGACVAGGFTYMGQPNLGIAYTLTARNKSATKTSNYLYAATGGYDNLGTVSLVAENADAGTDLGGRIDGLGTPAPEWTAGEYAVAATGATFSRGSAADGAFDALAIGVKVADTDAALTNRDLRATTTGACTTATDIATDCDARQIGAATKIRFGALKVDNASGSDRQDLPVRVAAMYYAGNPAGWAVNSLDTCTVLSVAPFTAHAANTATDACFTAGCTSNTAGTTGSIWLHDVGGTSIAQVAVPNAVSVLVAGSGTITLTRPVIAAAPTPGTLEFTLVTPSWLKAGSGRDGTAGNYNWNPMGRITFGLYGPATRKSKFIYLRESY